VLADPNYVGHLPPKVGFEEIAPILGAGVAVYKGIRMTGTRPGQWIAISGIGGLDRVAVQYPIAMGLHVDALDISADKLALARELGATLTIDASEGVLPRRSRRKSVARMVCWSQQYRAAPSPRPRHGPQRRRRHAKRPAAR
jgi:D-arabinose 1-dehydrogenase-like Zn-dependent alcohol dehydrogenase